MTHLPAPEYRAIVVVDIVGFTDPRRSIPDRHAAREGMYEVLKIAFAESDIDFDSCHDEDRGDGTLIIVPQNVSRRTLADRLPGRILAELRRYNSTRNPPAQIRLRIGLNSGDVAYDGKGWVGIAIDTAFRVLDSPEAKALFSESSDVVALIATAGFFSEVIALDPGAFPDDYREIGVSVKTYEGSAHLRLLGHGGQPATPGVSAAAARGDVLELLPSAERATLRGLLSGREVPRMGIIMSRAAGSVVPLPRREDVADAWEAFEYLVDRNAGPEGIPPALVFLELLAAELGGAEGGAIGEWVGQQARRLRVGSELAEVRRGTPPVPEEPHLHLTIMLDPDPIDPTRCVLASWRQDDPAAWPPTLGSVREVGLDELEYRVDEIVLDAEAVWAEQGISAVLEFLLPRTLLHLPVLRWHKEHESGHPRPLRYHYRITIRSLERMRARHWHRAWNLRWDSMLGDPSADRLHYSGSADFREHPIDAVLSDPRWLGLVLAETPPPQPETGAKPDELLAALSCGLPVLLWHPEAGPEALRELIDWMLDGDSRFLDLPDRRRLANLPTYHPPGDSLTQDLVVMWDDPKRVFVLDQPLIPARQ